MNKLENYCQLNFVLFSFYIKVLKKFFFNTIFKILHETFLRLLTIFQVFLTLRLTMIWFPNFNSRRQPFIFITKITETYFGYFYNVIPKIFGIDFSPMLALLWLQCLIEIST